MPGSFAPSSLATIIAHDDQPFNLILDEQVIAGDGTVNIRSGQVLLSKGSAAAITLPLPDRDGQRLTFITTTAQAHVVTQATDGFNAKGSSGTATLTAAIGNGFTVQSYNGHWYTTALVNTTIA